MQIIRGIDNLKPCHQGAVATIGNFDGVHLGHQAILKQVCDKAKVLGVKSMLICFEPQPKEFFDAYHAPARLTRFREKVELLQTHGVDLVLCLKFDDKTRSMSVQQFIDVLAHDIKLSALFVGDDFRFGNDQSGSYSDLQAAGRQHQFEVTNMYTLNIEDSRVSSTRIRECLAEGRLDEAALMLGHPYFISGKVIYGNQLGRTLNAATANIQLHRYRAPIEGVYAVEVEIEAGGGEEQDARHFKGVANVGVRPTLEQQTPKPILEVHLFDFTENIYGKTMRVSFLSKIREEKKFASLELLKTAIAADIEKAKRYFDHGELK